jgi:hypothetical protein
VFDVVVKEVIFMVGINNTNGVGANTKLRARICDTLFQGESKADSFYGVIGLPYG